MYKKMRYFILLSIIFLLSCGEDNKQIQIGLLLHKLEGTAWEKDARIFKEKAHNAGAKIIIKNANGNEVLQNEQAIELINKGVDVLIITAVNTNNAAAIVRKAKRNNIKVIAYRRNIKNSNIDCFAGFDSKKAGSLQANYIKNNFPDKANIIILEGDRNDENAEIISLQHDYELKQKVKNGSYKIVYKTFIENWSKTDAYFEFAKAFQFCNEKIDAVLCANDALATGVSKYLEQIGLSGKVLLTGMDAHLTACQRIINNQQGMTLYKPIDKLIDQIMRLVVSKSYENNDKKQILIDPVFVSKENIDKVIIDNRVYSKKELYSSGIQNSSY